MYRLQPGISRGLKPNHASSAQGISSALPNPLEATYLCCLPWASWFLVGSSKRALFWQEKRLLLPFAKALFLEVCQWILDMVIFTERGSYGVRLLPSKILLREWGQEPQVPDKCFNCSNDPMELSKASVSFHICEMEAPSACSIEFQPLWIPSLHGGSQHTVVPTDAPHTFSPKTCSVSRLPRQSDIACKERSQRGTIKNPSESFVNYLHEGLRCIQVSLFPWTDTLLFVWTNDCLQDKTPLNSSKNKSWVKTPVIRSKKLEMTSWWLDGSGFKWNSTDWTFKYN